MTGKSKTLPAYLTVYLALTLGVMVTLCLALIEGVRVSTFQMETACIADVCMDNVMAEYHRELFRRYNIMALDSSYGTRRVGRTNLEGRLAWYLDQNMNLGEKRLPDVVSEYVFRDFLKMELGQAAITDFSLLSDWNGKVFRKQAVEAIKDDKGVTMAVEALDWLKTVKDHELDVRDVEAEKKAIDEQIAAYQREHEGETVTVVNPTIQIENAKKWGILWLVLGDKQVSGKKLDQSDLIFRRIGKRENNHGNMELPEQNYAQKTTEKLLFQEYLLSYFGNFLDPKEGSALDYEIEYVLIGKNKDASNLRCVLNRILGIREAANVEYLYSDTVKRAEAAAVATLLSSACLVPELEELYEAAIILAWAYAESVYDLRTLMKGGKVPLLKDKNSWHLSVSSLFSDFFGDEGDAGGKGLTYADYLRILLLLNEEKGTLGRAMNVVEANVRLTPGNEAFRMDACYVQIGTKISVHSGFGYHLEIREDKSY